MIRTNRGRSSVCGTAEEETGRRKKNKDRRSSYKTGTVSVSRRGAAYAAMKEDEEPGPGQE